MPWFEYEGKTPGGAPITGSLEAADPDSARAELAGMQVAVGELSAVPARKPSGARITADDLMFFNEQLIGLTGSRMALDEGLAQLAADVQTPRLKHWIEGLVDDLRRGMTIDQAIATRESGLPVLYSQVVRAGIESGQLPSVLLGLNQHLRTSGATRRLIWEAASYPLVVGSLALVIMSFFFLFVVPKFALIFEDFGTHLPGLTLLAIEISENFLMILAVLAGLVIGVVLFWRMLRFSTGGRRWREGFVLGLPVLGNVHRASLIARFLRAVSVSVRTGIPLPRAMRLSSSATGSTLLEAEAERIAEQLERGVSINQAGQKAEIIPPLFGYCVKAASGRDDLPLAIAQLARSYEDRAVHAQGWLRAVLLPLFILIVGSMIFFAVAAMFLPLVQGINSVSGG